MARKSERGSQWTAAARERILTSQERSGLSIADFARREGLMPQLLYRWRRLRLPRESRPESTPAGHPSLPASAELTLVPIEFPPGESSEWLEAARFTVELRSGHKLHIPATASLPQIQQLLGVLQRCC